MDFTISKEQSDICESIQKLCFQKLNDHIFEADEQSVFPSHKWKICCEFGISGLPLPKEYGGLGCSLLTTAMAIEAFGYACKDEGLVFSVCAHLLACGIPIWRFGNEAQKEKYLPLVCSGAMIGANAITEADAGSDSKAITTKITKHGDYFEINGTKIFVTNGPVADLFIVYAKHPGGMAMADVSAVIIEKNEGLKIGQVFQKMGLRTSTTGEIVLENCRVPIENLLGRERFGMVVFNESMLWERIIMSAYHVGAMRQQYELVLDYANLRKQFGQKIIQFPSVSDKLIEMKMSIATAQLLLYKICWDYDSQRSSLADASILKLLTSEAKVKSSLDAIQIFGAYGYMKESLVEKQLRDSIAAKLYSGTNEIQKKIIAEDLGK